jgi:hypothetical protein
MQIGRAAVSTMNGAHRNIGRAIAFGWRAFGRRRFEIGWIDLSERMARFMLTIRKAVGRYDAGLRASVKNRARKITRTGEKNS